MKRALVCVGLAVLSLATLAAYYAMIGALVRAMQI